LYAAESATHFSSIANPSIILCVLIDFATAHHLQRRHPLLSNLLH